MRRDCPTLITVSIAKQSGGTGASLAGVSGAREVQPQRE